jgi:hypothetical protein
MPSVDPAAPALLPSLGPTRTDKLFLGFLVVLLLAVAAVGRMVFTEGQKNEVTKKNSEAWAQWLEQAGAERFKSDFEPKGCAGAKPGDDKGGKPGNTWADCLPGLLQDGGPLGHLRNPFNAQALVFAAKCEPGQRALAGAVVIEKLTPMPPGSAVPFYASPLIGQDNIDQKMQLRLSACDQGAYAGRSTTVAF